VWLNTREAADYCGMHVTTLWRAVKRGELKAGGVGRAVRFHRDELDRWLRGDEQK
jgi:excisionase family DNA binding protein